MLNTFERDLIANERFQDLLRSSAQRQRAEQAIRTGQSTGLLTFLTGRRRDAATARPDAAATANRVA
jgi:hypothetical protein